MLLIRRIRELLYDQGFTISGARNQLADAEPRGAGHRGTSARALQAEEPVPALALSDDATDLNELPPEPVRALPDMNLDGVVWLRTELQTIKAILSVEI